MNTGSCSDWRHYAPPSPPPPNSNLSAFAAPFSVNPYASGVDVSSHFMDSAVVAAETLSVPLPLPLHSNHFQSYGYNFFSSPNAEIDSSSRFSLLGAGACGERSSLVEGQPHHPSYSAINDHSSSSVPLPSYHWPSSSLDWPTLAETNKPPPELGFSAQNAVSWEQSPEFNNIRVWSSLPRKEHFAASDAGESMNQGYGDQDVKDYVESEVSHMIDWEKHNVPPSGNHLHDATPSAWGSIKPMPVELSGARVMQYPLMSLETHPEVPLNSMNNHLSKTGSYDKPSREDNVSGTDLNIENNLADEHVGNNNFCNTKDAFHFPGTAGCFDSGHLRMHLGKSELSSSNKDRCNPAEDSPCWKGASATHFSMFAPQEPQNTENNLKKFCEKINSLSSPRKSLISKIASKDCKSGGAVNDGPFQSKLNDFGLQSLDSFKTKEMMERNATPVKSQSPCTEHQGEENKLNKLTKQCTGDAEPVLFSPSALFSPSLFSPSALFSPTRENSAGKVSTERLNVQMLVDTMQNLSELLLNHSLNNACALRDRDCNILKNVISNLDKCLLNQIETSSESNDIHLNASVKKTTTKIGPASSKVEKPHGNLLDSFSRREDTEMTKADHMTKDIKKILVENFHDDDEVAEPQTLLYKNLWLEAEAALCSAYYRARYNRMKIEMDKYSCKKKEMEKLSKSEVVSTLSKSQSSASTNLDATNLEELSRLKVFIDMKKPNTMTAQGKCGQNLDSFINNYAPCSSSDKEAERIDEPSVMARYQVLKARVDHSCIDRTNQEESLEISAPGGMDNQNQVDLCLDSPISENIPPVMARNQVLKARVDHSCVDSTNQEESLEISAPGGMDNQNQVDLCLDSPNSENNSTAPKVMDDQNQVDLCLDSPNSENNTDYAASVVARFHILKSRIGGSCSISSDRTLIDGVGFPGKGIDDTKIAKSIPKFHKDLEDSQEIHPWEFQTQSCHSDGSDWEHVEKSL